MISLFLSINVMGQTQDPSPERCFEAYHVCGAFLDGFQAVLPDSNVLDTIWPDYIGNPSSGVCNLSNNFDNTIWLSFVACSEKVHLKIHFENCRHNFPNVGATGMQVGLYSRCRKDRSVDCDALENNTSGTLELEYDQFEPGELVFLVLDGYGQAICDFEIEVVEGVDKSVPTKPDASTLNDGEIIGQNQLNCNQKGIAQRYTLTKPECKINYPPQCTSTIPSSPNGIDSIKYVWEVSPLTGRYFVNNDSLGVDNDIVFTENGSYTISAKPIFHPAYGGVCENGACGDIISWTVNVRQADTIYNQPLEVCPGEIIDFCGHMITKDTVVFCEGSNCNVSAQSYVFKSARSSNIGKQYICNGSQFNFQGEVYTQDGSYSIKDLNDCTNTFVFEVVNINVDIQANASVPEINCTNTSSQLQSTLTTNWGGTVSLQWRDQANTAISTNATISVNQPNTYTCLASVTLVNGEVCKDESTVIITKDASVPILSFVVPTYKCRNQNEALPSITINSTRNLNSAVWRRPNGTVFNGLTIALDSALVASGIGYTFTGTSDNGCKVDTMIVVPYDFSKADLSVSGDILTCLSPTTRLTLSTNLALDSIKWQFSNGNGPYFICCDDQLVTSEQDQTGTYQATARTSSSRCFSTGSKFIAEDKIRPRNDLDNELKWFCNTKEVDIKPNNVESGANIAYNWSSISINGNIISPITAKDVVVGSIGNYVLAVTNTKNGCSRSDTIKVVNETNVPRNIVLETEDISCYGKKDGQIDIKLSEGGFAPYQYFVNNTLVDASNILSNLAPGNYQVVVKDNYECEYAQSVTIIEPIELTIDAPSQLDVEYDEAVLLDFISSYNISELSQIEWTRDNEVLGTSETLSLNANADQDITISIKNENGCEAKARIRIMVNSDLELFLPNAFSPNGDGNNDRFVPFKNKIPVLSSIMKVYDRYGNMVFDGEIEFNNPESGWDGSYNGKNVENGVYVYRINTIDSKGNKIDSSGTILVAR